jgi:hypothetical protein
MFYNSMGDGDCPSRQMNMKISALAAFMACLTPNLYSGAFSRSVVGNNGVMPMNFSGVSNFEILPQNAAALSPNLGAPLNEASSVLPSPVPPALPAGVFSAMPINPRFPALPSQTQTGKERSQGPLARNPFATSKNQGFPFFKNIRHRALEIREPLQNLKAWENDAKKSAENGRKISDDLWRLLSQGKSLPRRQLSKNVLPKSNASSLNHLLSTRPNSSNVIASQGLDIHSSNSLGELNSAPSPWPTLASGRDPAVSATREIPSPGDSNNEIFLDSLTKPSVPENGNGFGGDLLSGISFVGRFPVLIVMRVARRVLDFSLFRARMSLSQGSDPKALWGSSSERAFFIAFNSKGVLNHSRSALSAISSADMPPLSGTDDVAKWWLSLSLLPILVAAILFRLSFL